MQELREMLRRELDKLQRKGSMSASDLDLMYKVVDIIKDSYEIEEYADAEHSHAGGHGGMSRVYMDGGEYGGNSYRRQRRDSRGRYSREGGGYSYDDGMAEVWEILEMMETGLPDEQREAIRRFRREMQK